MVYFVYASMDLNGLKVMNDILGHSAGDLLLQGAAECMKQCKTVRLYQYLSVL